MTQFNGAEFAKNGFTRVTIASQNYGGRGSALWQAAILADNLQTALGDADLLIGLARDVKRGDKILLAAFPNEKDFSDELRHSVCELLVTDVIRPSKENPKQHPGRVSYRIIEMFVLGPTPEKVIQDRGGLEAPAPERARRKA